ncbi:MAG: hypothetical protein GY845_18700 [Planctomycetes bacterium]|nr:hypothetical protein [Planctomycetota bacterium]
MFHSIPNMLEFTLDVSSLAFLSGAKRYQLYANFLSTIVENSLQISPFYAKQSQFFAFFARKRRFNEKTNPIQTQFKANKAKNKPNLTQNKANLSRRSSERSRIQTQIRAILTVLTIICRIAILGSSVFMLKNVKIGKRIIQ